jgi:glyoxylase-like metal-dependent hydrolase (beta-lactamase superfamily II)
MPNYICVTCGVQYAESDSPPPHCIICEDDRQYVNPNGQSWTTLETLRRNHQNVFKPQEPGLIGIATEPKVAIGQRALLIRTPQGNVLWDCISYLDDATVDLIQTLGGIQAIAISHPHFYDSMVEWSRAFDAPIYLHAANREWVMRPDPAVHFWETETYTLQDGITMIRCGGHFPGSTALHWAAGAEGKGVLMTADTFMVVPDKRYVAFMHSFPNLVPLPPAVVEATAQAIEPFDFERMYSGWFEAIIPSGAKAAIQRSAERYRGMVQD